MTNVQNKQKQSAK